MTKSATPKAGRPRLERPSRVELKRLYVRGRLSLRDVALALGIGKDRAAAALDEAGIPRRPHTFKRGRLADIPLALLRANIKAEGLAAHARTLGVPTSTLADHVRRQGRAKAGGK